MRSFAEWCLSSVTLGKEFAECKLAFAECNWHSAKLVNPVVDVRREVLDGRHRPRRGAGGEARRPETTAHAQVSVRAAFRPWPPAACGSAGTQPQRAGGLRRHHVVREREVRERESE